MAYVGETAVTVVAEPYGRRAPRAVVALYSCDNYGEDPQYLDPDDARAVAAALVEAADRAEMANADGAPTCTTCCRQHGVDGWNPRHLPTIGP